MLNTNAIPLSELVYAVQESIDSCFAFELFWIKAQIADVKKYESKKWCFLKLIEKQNEQITTEIKANIWNTAYTSLVKFEQITGNKFADGLEIICAVTIKFHPRYGLSFEIQEIDVSHTLGSLELHRRETLNKLLTNHPKEIQYVNDQYLTTCNQNNLPIVIQHIALITANNSDGQRDFINELNKNNYAYTFIIDEYLCTVQGDNAHIEMTNAITKILKSNIKYDCIALVRGGGGQTDFAPFNEYILAEAVALCPIPILTGIGHDRNTSIVDEMARQFKTPTKVANFIIDKNADFERSILQKYDSIKQSINNTITKEIYQLQLQQKTIELLSPQRILDQGYALLKQKDKVVSDIAKLNSNEDLFIFVKSNTITTSIKNIT
jgi:exodeoxyribonuclease VII large subunit